jgi:predicted secreted Zn-dependent protease
MKKEILYLLLVVFIGCSPKLKSNIEKSFAALSDDALVVVLEIIDDQSIIGETVGVVEAKDGGLAVNCTYYENVLNLKKMARELGANLVKITQYKTPDKWSNCHRLRAKVYKVSNPKNYETQIEWSADRKLTWDDFKGESDTINHPNTLAMTNSGFGYESGISMFKEGQIFVQSVFNTNESWVVSEGRNDYVLRHEQIHFDITEIYSRKLRKELSDSKITSNNLLQAKAIFDKVFDELQKRQARYDNETKHGDKKDTQENWEAIVEIELAKYNFYRENK